jgi:hypothetical protein
MIDITPNNNIPGRRGQTRSSWRDATHLRGMLLRLMQKFPNFNRDDRDELEEKFLAKLRRSPDLIDEAGRYWLDNNLAKASTPVQPRRSFTKSVAAIADQVRDAITLNMMMPNGKKLRDCTGVECVGFGQQYIRLGEHVGDRLVGAVVKSDAKVAKIVFGDTKPLS